VAFTSIFSPDFNKALNSSMKVGYKSRNANYRTNPQAYVISKKTVSSKSVLKLKAAPGGGYAISIKPTK
jgi:hypothetical protein